MSEQGSEDDDEIKNAEEEDSELEAPLVSMIPSTNDPKYDSDGDISAKIDVHRPALTVDKKQSLFMYESRPKESICHKVIRTIKNGMECSPERIKQIAYNRIPLLDWLPKYNIRKWLTGDCIAGVTVSVMHIPQGMAYAMLAGLDPIHGIYMAFFPVLAYAIFGTSKHCSVGTFAVVCIMTGKVVHELSSVSSAEPISHLFNSTLIPHHDGYSPVEVATVCSFAVGFWLMILGFLQAGALSVFFSDMLVSGFTTGAAIHVLTSQVKHLFGLSIPLTTGSFKLIRTYINLVKIITQTNVVTFAISVSCLVILICNNELLKPRIQKYTKIPIPIELILVIAGTLVSEYGNISPNHGVFVVGPIPTGLPLPRTPPMGLFSAVLLDSLIIAVVSYTISYAMAKILAKEKYKVNPTQELYAQSISNFVGSLFGCAPISTSLSRSLIQTSVGGNTQLTSLVSCSLLLLVLLYIGPFFETLPNCVLACIILVALKGMLLQVKDFLTILRVSYLDASIWLVTFLTVVIVDIDAGLLVGVLTTMFVLLLRNQSVRIHILGRYGSTDIFLDKTRYARVVEVPEFKICEVSGNLHFANQSSFRKSIIQLTGLDPRQIIKLKMKEETCQIEKLAKRNGSIKRDSSSYSQDIFENGNVISEKENANMDGEAQKHKHFGTELNGKVLFEPPSFTTTKNTSLNMKISDAKYLIIDLSGVGQIDASAARNLKSLQDTYRGANIAVVYTGITDYQMESLSTAGVLEKMPADLLIHSIHDAVSILSVQNDSGIESVRL